MRVTRVALACALALGSAGIAQAQATVKMDGKFRSSLGLGASLSSGNSDAGSISLTGDAVRATEQGRISLYRNSHYATAEGETTSDQTRLGGRYDYKLGPSYFAFGGLDLAHNRFANINLRAQLGGGLGWHVIKPPTTTFDVFDGLSCTVDDCIDPTLIASPPTPR